MVEEVGILIIKRGYIMGQVKAKTKTIDISTVIKDAVNAGLQAGRMQASRTAGDTYKATEQRLYAYPTLVKKIISDKERLSELLEYGAPSKSHSITRFIKSGVRLSPSDILDAMVQDVKATIASDEYETGMIERALKTIEDDAYYSVIVGKFFESKKDDEIAVIIPCDASTVRRNRGRLVRKLAIWLYGAQAL